MREQLSKQDRRRAWLWAAAIVAGLIVLAAGVVLLPRVLPGGNATLPEESAELLTTADGLDEITVEATFDPSRKLLTAVQTLTLRNRTGQTQSAAVLRSFSGAYLSESTSPAASDELYSACYGERFSTGGLILDGAEVNGASVRYDWLDEARTVLSLPAENWAADGSVTVRLTYHVNVPDCRSRFGTDGDIYALGNVFPTPAVWEDGAWRTDAYIAVGDPFLSECANWTVRLTLPDGWRVAATGAGDAVHTDDGVLHTLTAQAVRDFALVLSDRFQSAQALEDGVLVTAYARSAASARRMLDAARQALRCFAAQWGAYAYPTFTVVEVSFPYGGMEYPRLAMIGADVIASGGDTLSYTVAHETAHQWWYAMVGSDSVNQPWQDESLAEYALLAYIGSVSGEAARESAAFERIETAMRVTVSGNVTPGSPIDYFADLDEYSLVVYRRGAAMWLALEKLMGRESLGDALRDYQAQYRFRIATRQSLTDVLSAHAGFDLSALMTDYLDTRLN